ncbi:uncharacterized protein LOC111380506 [Olea europaea var. sylvestris]|uniref:uncharacterized protein LOC111380506 n=1 Tax=Olea europaea var. sylvestris TaxID=158386 RepID=UPI000C1D43D3|nr:uncharacterized protein LOC111380506 [Olea europaea var. sylvestris]
MTGMGRRRRAWERKARDQRISQGGEQARHFRTMVLIYERGFYVYVYLEHILGIGTEKPNAWAFDTTQFDGILKKLKVRAIEIKNDRADKKDKLIAKKVEADKQNKASKNTHDTAVKVTRPQGRYKRREKGKLVQAYSSQDLEGIIVKKVKRYT